MSEKLDPKETVTFEELLMSNTITQEALINLLERNGLIKKQDLLEEIKRLKNLQACEIRQAGEKERELIEGFEEEDDDF